MKEFVRKRIAVIICMLYLVVMVTVAYRGLIGDIFAGYSWRSGGWSLFPIPFNPSWFGLITATVHVPLNPLELLVYLIFVGHSVWIFWEVIGVLYIVYPRFPFLQSIVKKGKSNIGNRFGRSG